ncbi:MAG: eukaryotic-like serine/threonine-protein kinase [Thermoanaerobaculia bacterium]|jgi:TolB-like protein/Tfp pilus assembly protein PilF/predicted Ser/Thr protein kinase|nr:eukaryotic-like serine/threonine-protein kinase [Thermoanaerobaculia bacterium]
MPLDRERIAQYRILRRLGSGGMGEVYLAEDQRLSRQVALKIITPERSADESVRRRFLREAHAVAGLSHAGVAHVYDAGTDDGLDFIAMEWIEGETLTKRISAERIAIDEILDIAVQLADAVAEAHEHGIVHRDIKPSNVMITPRGRVKILDFGIARLDESALPGQASDLTGTASQTNIGMLIGTANYMSPEQALGESADRRSDVFSIGVLLYELITHRLPFAGKSTGDTLHRITSLEPEPMARFNYELPIELERIVRKCLEKLPAHRYRSARELHTDLASITRDRSSAPSAPWLGRARPMQRRVGFALAALLATAAVVAAILLLKNQHPVPPLPNPAPRTVAVLPFASEAAGDDDLAEGLTDTAINRLAEDGRMAVMARSTVFHFRKSELLPQQIGQRLNVDTVVTGSLRSSNGSVRLIAELVNVRDGSRIWSHEYSGTSADTIGIENDLANGLAEAFHSPAGPRRATLAGANRAEAHNWYLRGRIAFYRRELPQAMDAFQRATKTDPSYAPPFAALADVETVLERYLDVPASRTAPIARASAEKALALDPALPEGHVALASVYDTYDWNWKAAESEYRQAIALRPSDALAHQWYAMLLSRLGRHDEALREITTAQSLDPLSPVVSTAAANILYYARSMEPARQQILKAMNLDSDGTFPLARIQYGLILDQQQKSPDAVALLTMFGVAPRNRNTGVAALGITAAHAGNTALARQLAEELGARAATLSTEYYTAAVYAALGDRDAAFSWLERAYLAHSAYLGYAKVDPALDTLRHDPRFNDLLTRLHLG